MKLERPNARAARSTPEPIPEAAEVPLVEMGSLV